MNTTTPARRRTLAAALMAVALTGAAAVPAVASAAHAEAPGHDRAAEIPSVGYGESARPSYQKAVAVQLFKGVFERGDTSIVDRFVRPDYIQHNPLAPDGAGALKYFAALQRQQYPDIKWDIKRVISEGDLVAVHSNYVVTPGTRGLAAVDLFRVRGGRIVEHWDALQEVPETSANDNTMF